MNAIQQFVAAMGNKKPSMPIANADKPVSRLEFASLQLAVANLAAEIDTLSSPGKLGAVLNQAMVEIANETKQGAPKSDSTMPPRQRTVSNSGTPRTRPPLALQGERR